jgi:ribosomal protein S18 acetylase RimI-like enzyme
MTQRITDPLASLELREAAQPSDIRSVGELVTSTGFFSAAEIAVALELVTERLERGDSSTYQFAFAEAAGVLVSYACYGEIPCTVGSYDLYWIAVAPDWQGKGLGSAMLAYVETLIAASGGRRIYIETSSRIQYAPTRAFYGRNGYREAAVLEDYYAPGDAKHVFQKFLG